MPDSGDTTAILNDGRELVLFWLKPEQTPDFRDFISGLCEDDIAHLSLDLKDQEQLTRWLKSMERGELFLLAARDPEAGNRLAGYCALSLGRGTYCHMAQVETLLHPDYCNLGLGSNLIREAAGFASERELDFLEAQIHVEDRALMDSLKNLGFELKAIIEDYRKDCSGKAYDVIIMLKRLSYQSNKDFLYRY
jgi:ribosomal protein S18 acetylase RimI-like enzyme